MTGHVCRGIIAVDISGMRNAKLGVAAPVTEEMIIRCGKPATRYQKGCANPIDGWCCDYCYTDEEEWEKL